MLVPDIDMKRWWIVTKMVKIVIKILTSKWFWSFCDLTSRLAVVDQPKSHQALWFDECMGASVNDDAEPQKNIFSCGKPSYSD